MTREELIKAINDSEERWSCPEYGCDKPEEEGNVGECCLKCAEKQLEEYENKIRIETINAAEDIKYITEQTKRLVMTLSELCKRFSEKPTDARYDVLIEKIWEVEKVRTEYRITGRFAKDKDRHVVDSNRNWTLEDANNRIDELIAEQEATKKRGYSTSYCGMIGIDTPYYPEYELLDLRVEARKVSRWNGVEN